uniref:Tyrosine-protein phosphatase domain-containing protein n=1 Tax=Brugia malayi TaxID=6279 RepID=A8PI24_BRUMA
MDAVNSVRRHLENEKLKEVDFGAISGSKNNRNNCHINLTHSTNRNTTQSTDLGYYNWCKKGLHVVNYALHHSPSSYSNALSSAFSSSRRNDVMVDAVVSPTVIHCLTGAHESGVYLLVELMIHCIEHNMEYGTHIVFPTVIVPWNTVVHPLLYDNSSQEYCMYIVFPTTIVLGNTVIHPFLYNNSS